MPPELFERPGISLKPEPGRKGPKLWVRRLVIWREPKIVIRDVPLRPGLNIIWSPDSQGPDSPVGHGGGKTTFCRLLRYCLGEETSAPQALRQRIGEVLPKGHVGAEIILDGQLWVVVRALGHRHRDFVQRGGQLEDAFADGSKTTGMDQLIDAVTESVMGASASLMPRSIGADDAWRALLAWMTRDQECRLGHALDWRSSDSDSRSPVVNRSAEDRLLVVRAAIGALTSNEMAALLKEEQQKDRASKLKALQGHLEWQIVRTRQSLKAALGGSSVNGVIDTPIALTLWRTAADEQLARAVSQPGRPIADDLQTMRRRREEVRERLDRLKQEQGRLQGEVDTREQMVGFVRSELPEAFAKQMAEENPVCPICKVLIDKALAEGCGITTETCDLHALRAENERKRELLANTERDIVPLRGELAKLPELIASASQDLAAADELLRTLERSFDDASKSVRAAQRLQEDVDHFEAMLGEFDKARFRYQRAENDLVNTRESLTGYRQSSSVRIRQMSDWFDVVLRELVPGVCGSAKIDGNGLKLDVDWGGNRSTAAIDSLKIVAFDLAILVMSIEQQLCVPGMLVHDSPREADLSATVYARLFAFADKLERCSVNPAFQYILTTTTAPPEEFQKEPWLRLSVKGAPDKERLLGVDL